MDINNENNFIKYDGKTDLTEVAKEAYKDGAKGFVQEAGQMATTVVNFLNNTIGVPFELFNAWSRPKIEQIKSNIQNRVAKIPSENFVNPPMNILLPAIDGLKYNLDENILKEKFENLIVNSCNSTYSDKIHPRFAEIIKQLSCNDAVFLKELSKDLTNGFPIANIVVYKDSTFKTLFPNCYYSEVLEEAYISSSIDNLMALGLIKVDYSNFIVDEEAYEKISHTKSYRIFKLQEHGNISLQKGVLSVTIFGRNFINVCI